MDAALPKVEDLSMIMAQVFSCEATPESVLRRIDEACTSQSEFLLSEYERLIAVLYRNAQYFMFLKHGLSDSSHHFFAEALAWQNEWERIEAGSSPEGFAGISRLFLRLTPGELKAIEKGVKKARLPKEAEEKVVRCVREELEMFRDDPAPPTSPAGQYHGEFPIAHAYSPNCRSGARRKPFTEAKPLPLTRAGLAQFRKAHLSPRSQKGGRKKRGDGEGDREPLRYKFWVDELARSQKHPNGFIQFYSYVKRAPRSVSIRQHSNWYLELQRMLRRGLEEYAPQDFFAFLYETPEKPTSWDEFVERLRAKRKCKKSGAEKRARASVREHFKLLVTRCGDIWPRGSRYFLVEPGKPGALTSQPPRYGFKPGQRFCLLEAI